MAKPTRKKKRPASGLKRPTAESPTLTHRKERLQRLVFGVSFVVLVAAVTEFPLLGNPSGAYDIDREAVASRTIQAARNFQAVDLASTAQRRQEAAARVLDTFRIDDERVENQLTSLRQRIKILKDRRPEVETAIRERLLHSDPATPADAIVDAVLTERTTAWKEDPLLAGFPDPQYLRLWVTPKPESIPKRVPRETSAGEEGSAVTLDPPEPGAMEFINDEPLNTVALNALRYILTSGVRQPGSVPAGEPREGGRNIFILRNEPIEDLKAGEERQTAAVPNPDSAREALRNRIAIEAQKLAAQSQETDRNWDAIQQAAHEMAKPTVSDTLYYDSVITEGQRQRARDNAEMAFVEYHVDQMLQEEGHLWDDQSREAVKTYWNLIGTGAKSSRSIVGPVLANMLFVALLLVALRRAMPAVANRRASAYKGVNIVLLVACGVLVVGRIIKFFDPTGYLVPVAAAAVLLTILANARLAAVGTALIAILLSIQYQQSWQLMAVVCAMSFTGIVSLYRVRKRGDMAAASIRATFIGVLTVVALALSAGSVLQTTAVGSSMLEGSVLLQNVTKIVLNGILCLFLIPGLLSPLERLFGVTTDIQLLEYSDLNNELLSRLAIEVPATYAHSLMMGQLAEAASDAIGANGLLARVSAYYHDIGKLRRPEYFSENQTGYNIHEDISPRLSARAIASHVTEGAELAREYHLPQPIIRGILEHHGTLLISFFYQQALEQQKHGDVREEDYRYPGPKPQSPETAILMICDAVESGVRSLSNLNEERLREFIDKIIQQRSEDRQFDECDLTLKKLDTIGDVLTKRLRTSMHGRIAYPERKAPPRLDNVIHIEGARKS